MPKMNPAAHTLAGKLIDSGRFELISILGSGAYGVVYLATDVSSPPDQPTYYAVKCLSKGGLDARQRKFQRREIALHQLASAHPGVVTLHRVVEESEWIFVVLDFCPDGDLFAMITERQLFLGKDALIKNVFLQVVNAVEYIHNLGIHHRDLKPENILCRNNGSKLLIADFGLATSEKSSEAFGCGSSFYMSPECQGGVYVKGVPYNTKANDIWALGVILVNLTCGRNPWKQATISDDTFRAYLADPDFLRKILPVSLQLNDILKRIFAINPEKRISLAELRDAVTNIQTFTMTQDELMAAHSAARKVAVQQRIPPAQPAPKVKPVVVTEEIQVKTPKPRPQPIVVVAPPTPAVGTTSSYVTSPSSHAPSFNAVPALSPATPTFPKNSPSSASDASLILTPETAPVQDGALNVVPEGNLDGNHWEMEPISPPTRKHQATDGPMVKGSQHSSGGRGFLRDVFRKIRAL